jgi:Ca2+-transporting ATPase
MLTSTSRSIPERPSPAPESAPAQSRSTGLLLPVHISLAGRARFRLPSLYRAERLRELVENHLSTVDGVRSVQANILTASLLIRFDPAVSTAELSEHLEETLLKLPVPGLRRRPEERRSPVTVPPAKFKPRRGAQPKVVAAKPARASEETPWHALSREEAIARLESTASGLSAAACAERLARLGANVLPQAGRRSDLSILLEQIATAPVAMLGISALVSILTGGLIDAAVIGGVVVINTLIGFLTERQSETIIATLAPSGPHPVSVRRDDQFQQVASETLVPGDVMMLVPGSLVAADARLLGTERLSVDESALTGESMPVEKQAAGLCRQDAPLGDRHNMVYKGTLVTGGSGMAIVVGTGLNSEIGRIQALAEAAEPPRTVVEQQLDTMGNQLALLSSSICGVVFLLGLLRGQGWLPMLKTSISLAVAAVPEGLPTVATTTLAIGIRNMRRRNVLVRRMDAIETLGTVQVFCMDKTGTLTLNRMTVTALHVGLRRLVADQHGFWIEGRSAEPRQIPECQLLLEVAALCNEVELNGGPTHLQINGSPTERALMELAVNAGLDVSALRRQHPELSIQYRSEERPYMVTVHRADGGQILTAVKGSPEQVLELCRWYLQDGELKALGAAERSQILQENERMAGTALRVLGLAYALQNDATDPMGSLVWLGLTGMTDPLRPGMTALLNRFHRAGIQTSIITGDQSATAYAIAKELNLTNGRPVEILDSVSLDKLDPALLSGVIQRVQVFSRVSPAHKLQIVQGLQRAGKVVAMTGDGINDGPALKAADLGVAMGSSGTEVARSVADIVLEDDNLTTMETAIRDGRTIHSNIRKAIRFLLATNLSEIAVMLVGVGAGLGQPLNPMQLLWINLATDVFPALALAMEPAEPDILEQPPRDPQTPLLSAQDLRRLALESAIITGGSFASYGYALLRYGPGPQANTHTFMTLTLAQLLHSLSSRSETHSLFDKERLSPNPHLNLALGVSLSLQVLTVLIPGLRQLLGTTPLSLLDSLVIGASAVVPLLINESTKKASLPATLQPVEGTL